MHGPSTARSAVPRRHPRARRHAEGRDGAADDAALEPLPSRVHHGHRAVSDHGDRRAVGDQHHERQPDHVGHGCVTLLA